MNRRNCHLNTHRAREYKRKRLLRDGYKIGTIWVNDKNGSGWVLKDKGPFHFTWEEIMSEFKVKEWDK